MPHQVSFALPYKNTLRSYQLLHLYCNMMGGKRCYKLKLSRVRGWTVLGFCVFVLLYIVLQNIKEASDKVIFEKKIVEVGEQTLWFF